MSKIRATLHAIETLESAATPGQYKVTVIRPGFNKSKQRFYPAEVLRRDGHVFKGSKMFANHQTAAEAKARPEGNVNDWVATLTDVAAEADGSLSGTVKVHDPSFDAKLQSLKASGLLGEMGVSIRAYGEGEQREHEGVNTTVMESLLKSRSVDFVTYAGAGGQVQEADGGTDIEEVTEAQVRELRPDLVLAIETAVQEKKNMTDQEIAQKVTAAVEAALTPVKAELSAEKAKNATLVNEAATAVKANAVIKAQGEIKALIDASKLPAASKTRIAAQFKEADKVDGVEAAIKAEATYLKEAGVVVKVSGNGKADNGIQEADGEEPTEAEIAARHKSLVESYVDLGFTKEEAEIAARKR